LIKQFDEEVDSFRVWREKETRNCRTMSGSWKNSGKEIDPVVACQSCGASLPVGSLSCKYCKTTFDRDMSRLKYGLESLKSDRDCPACNKSLKSIDLEIGYKFIVERCQDCLGIFMDKLELEEFLAWVKMHPGGVDTPRLLELLNCPERPWEKVVYRNCPVCKEQMTRRNFGRRSGTVVDICRKHGTWLDAGELTQLVKWSGAGGSESPCMLQDERKRINREASKTRAENKEMNNRGAYVLLDTMNSDSESIITESMIDILASIFGLD